MGIPFISRMRHGACALALITVAFGIPSAHALPVTGFAGYDHARGGFGRRTDSFLAGAGLSLPGVELLAAGLRYDDNTIGRGYGVIGIAGLPLGPMTQARVAVTRLVGDEDYRAWRLRAGPRFSFPTGQSLWLAWLHDRDNAGTRSNGAIAEASTPLVAGLSGRMNASWATVPQGPAAMQGAVGLGWRAVPQLEIGGEVGMARNGGGSGGWLPGRGVTGLPSIGESTDDGWSGTALIGIRLMVP